MRKNRPTWWLKVLTIRHHPNSISIKFGKHPLHFFIMIVVTLMTVLLFIVSPAKDDLILKAIFSLVLFSFYLIHFGFNKNLKIDFDSKSATYSKDLCGYFKSENIVGLNSTSSKISFDVHHDDEGSDIVLTLKDKNNSCEIIFNSTWKDKNLIVKKLRREGIPIEDTTTRFYFFW